MSPGVLLGFAGLCALLALTPGPDTFLVLRHGLVGTRFGLLAAAGSAAGSLVWAAVVALGLADLLASSPTVFLVVKVVGGAYLLHLGLTGFMHRGDAVQETGEADSKRVGRALWSGLLSCLLNPKVGLFFLAVVPQFLPAGSITLSAIMVLGAVDAVVAFAYLVAVAVLAANAVTWLRSPKVSRRLAGASSIVLGALGIATFATVA
jgi:threonine/homoserine/homoserine lactone efflux protein